MRAVMLEVPAHLLEERRRRGADRWDEMWEGELHMVPPPGGRHQSIGTKLVVVLEPIARARGLELSYETGLYRADDDYRVPDIAVYRPDRLSERGIEQRAELVIETVSPGDESRAKLPWYAARGVGEVLLVDRDSLAVEMHALRDGALVPVEPAYSRLLGVTVERAGDDRLRVVTADGVAELSIPRPRRYGPQAAGSGTMPGEPPT